MKKYYAGIGSRETPAAVLQRMTKCADYLREQGYTLRSGGAMGADRAFEMAAGDNKDIYYANDEDALWTHLYTDHFHPAPTRLSEYARKLMNRNAMQILGRSGCEPVEFVVCWTKDGKDTGGTGQALRIAKYFSITIFNFYFEDSPKKLFDFVRGEE